ncbi:L-amino-acid oxidase [Talaromyces pinophilus]|nr:L-amino-acid oxidase [Talaromyces pinophilus]
MGFLQPTLTSLLFCSQLIISCSSSTPLTPRHEILDFKGPLTVEAGGIANIHISYTHPLSGPLSLHYGSCSSPLSHPKEYHYHHIGSTAVGDHPFAKRHVDWEDQRPQRFVWLVPELAQDGGCLFAYSGADIVGRSEPVTVMKRRSKRHGIILGEIGDVEGPWFDGVEYLSAKEPHERFVAQAKKKSIGILGAGMSGLMSALLLESVGVHDWKIIEASNRLGGRVHTAYLDNTTGAEYQYQEMGPMRFPVDLTLGNETVEINDHKMVFQLADVLNKINGNSPEYIVNFIKWIQSNSNAPKSNSTTTYSNITAATAASDGYNRFINLTDDKLFAAAKNVFTAHRSAVDAGILDFSESGYIKYVLGADNDITDEIDTLSDNYDSWYYDSVYFSASTWKTIDQGLNRLPLAFTPLVENRTMFGTAVQEISYNETTDKVMVGYRLDPFQQEADTIDFDYVITAVPFTKVRLWRLPGYSSLLQRAINTLQYETACKVALKYKTRFWEHLDKPIFGGCGSTSIPAIGSICYPSYNLNASGPGVLLGSYISGTTCQSLGALTDIEHVSLVQRAIVEIHGSIASEQFTGSYSRKIWANDEFQAGDWAAPAAGQQELYLPAYFRTEYKTIFVGEHTSYTHAWIWSALESAVRGTTQLLLDMGLVDEAKQITGEWMARWIRV